MTLSSFRYGHGNRKIPKRKSFMLSTSRTWPRKEFGRIFNLTILWIPLWEQRWEKENILIIRVHHSQRDKNLGMGPDSSRLHVRNGSLRIENQLYIWPHSFPHAQETTTHFRSPIKLHKHFKRFLLVWEKYAYNTFSWWGYKSYRLSSLWSFYRTLDNMFLSFLEHYLWKEFIGKLPFQVLQRVYKRNGTT